MDELKYKPSDAVREFLDGVHGVVEATSAEYNFLYERWHVQRGYQWEETVSGFGVCVGSIDSRWIYLSLRTARVQDKKILFIEPTSVVVDWDQVWTWLQTYLRESAFRAPGLLRKSDAGNFHLVYSD